MPSRKIINPTIYGVGQSTRALASGARVVLSQRDEPHLPGQQYIGEPPVIRETPRLADNLPSVDVKPGLDRFQRKYGPNWRDTYGSKTQLS